jgi:hypothetical protein
VELYELNGVGEVSHKLPSNLLALKLEKLELTNRCPYGTLLMEFRKVGKIHVFLVDLLKQSNTKVLRMEIEKPKLSGKFIGL